MDFLSRLFPKPRIPLEEQLKNLASCGIHLKPEFSVDTLLESFDREKYEERPYVGVVIRLGGELEREPFTPLSENLWHLDAECIEGDGSYARIAERMRDLSQGELPIRNIRDHVDICPIAQDSATLRIRESIHLDPAKLVGIVCKRSSRSACNLSQHVYIDSPVKCRAAPQL